MPEKPLPSVGTTANGEQPEVVFCGNTRYVLVA